MHGVNRLEFKIDVMGVFNGVLPKQYLEDGLGRFIPDDLTVNYYDGDGMKQTAVIPIAESDAYTLYGGDIPANEFEIVVSIPTNLTLEDMNRVVNIESFDIDYDCDRQQTDEDHWDLGMIRVSDGKDEIHFTSQVLDKFNNLDPDKFFELYGEYPNPDDYRAIGDLCSYDRFDGTYPEETEVFFDDFGDEEPEGLEEEKEPF